MLVKTLNLTSTALDWAVGYCLGTNGVKPGRCMDCEHHEERAGRDGALYYCNHPKSIHNPEFSWGDAISPFHGVHPNCPITELTPKPYSTEWKRGGPVLEDNRIGGFYDSENQRWQSADEQGTRCGTGPTLLVAAMRTYVNREEGDDLEIPKELL